MTPNDFMYTDKHQHTAKHQGAVFEVCDCGATRQHAFNSEPNNTWHVCHSCISAGYRFTVNGAVRKEEVK